MQSFLSFDDWGRTVARDDDFGAFYAASFSPLCAQIYVLTGDIDEAHNLTQAAFGRAAGRWHRLSRDRDPVAWVHHCAWMKAVHQSRGASPRPALDEPSSGPLARLFGLPTSERQAIVLHHLAGYPVAEVADMTRANQSTVRGWLDHQGPARDDLVAASSALRDAALAHVRPPGVPSQPKVNPRWIIGAAATAGLATATAVAALILPPSATPTPQAGASMPQAGTPTPAETSSTASASAPMSPPPSTPPPSTPSKQDPTVAPTTSIPGGVSSGGVPSGGGQGDGGGFVGGAGAHTGPPASMEHILDGCLRGASVTSVFDNGWVSVKWDNHERCPPDVHARVFWASYVMASDGSGLLYATETYELDDATPTARFRISWPASCETWFVVVGPVGIKDSLSAAQMSGQAEAYPGTGPWEGAQGPTDSIHYDVDPNCERLPAD